MNIDFLYHVPSGKIKPRKLEQCMVNDALEKACSVIEEADAILIGAGSGLSSSCGFEYYHNCSFFEQHFADYRERYGFESLFEGLNYIYSTPEEQWNFLAQYIKVMRDEPAGYAYRLLNEIVSGRNEKKEYFVLTTNIDSQCYKVFPKEKIWAFQGDVRSFQCSQPCHGEIYDNEMEVKKMLGTGHDYVVAADAIPRCPYCGRQMSLWVREENFLEGNEWNRQKQQYQKFLSRNQHRKIVFLELGVGDMTPGIIKFPFWEMTHNQENSNLICINQGKVLAPEHIRDKTVMLPMDIGEALKKIREKLN